MAHVYNARKIFMLTLMHYNAKRYQHLFQIVLLMTLIKAVLNANKTIFITSKTTHVRK